MTSTNHLSKIDRAGARRIARAWKNDSASMKHASYCFQTVHRNPLSHAMFFQHLKTLTPKEREHANNRAIFHQQAHNSWFDVGSVTYF